MRQYGIFCAKDPSKNKGCPGQQFDCEVETSKRIFDLERIDLVQTTKQPDSQNPYAQKKTQDAVLKFSFKTYDYASLDASILKSELVFSLVAEDLPEFIEECKE